MMNNFSNVEYAVSIWKYKGEANLMTTYNYHFQYFQIVIIYD